MNKRAFSLGLRSRAFLAASSGILLTLSYPHPAWGFLAWVALVPLFFAIRKAETLAQAARAGVVFGLVFFGLSMHWLTHVAPAGWILWTLMQTVYLTGFTCLAYAVRKAQAPLWFRVLWVALAWTVIEILRSEVPIFGMEWNLLGYSQAPYPVMIQSASIWGAYGLGFLIAIVNVCVFELFAPKKLRKRGVPAALFAVSVGILIGLMVYGDRRLGREEKPEEYLRVSVLQGNIPQSVKWELMAKEKILEIYIKLTQLAAVKQPDLIIWPEAAFPGYFNGDVAAARNTQLAKEVQTPLLIGALYWVTEKEVYNSAYLLDKNGVGLGRYDKLRLVPFGEFIPLKPIFFWLTPIAESLGISDFSAGTVPVLFRWAREDWPFGVLICFEDVFTDLSREYADRGAKFLTVITNDAWFGKTGSPFQHFQASVFRAVENGVAVVRAGNTGVSGFISRRGELLATVRGEKGGEIFELGHETLDLPLATETTFYRRGGFLFPYVAAALFLILAVFLRRKLANE